MENHEAKEPHESGRGRYQSAGVELWVSSRRTVLRGESEVLALDDTFKMRATAWAITSPAWRMLPDHGQRVSGQLPPRSGTNSAPWPHEAWLRRKKSAIALMPSGRLWIGAIMKLVYGQDKP